MLFYVVYMYFGVTFWVTRVLFWVTSIGMMSSIAVECVMIEYK